MLFEVPHVQKTLSPILEFVLESQTLLPELGMSWGVDSQSVVDWRANEL
jgi:hypothetical protein